MAEYNINKIKLPNGDIVKLVDETSGYTKNTGTVTSVGLQNATNGGLSVSGSPVTGSGTISVGHSNVLTNAQTTQALYPIAIDKNGHISSYGTAVDPEDIFLFEVTQSSNDDDDYTTTATPAQLSNALSEGKVPVVKVNYNYGVSAYHYFSAAYEESNSFHYAFISPYDGGDSRLECIATSASASSFTEIYVSASDYSYASHVHGNINAEGKISSTSVTPGNGDYILISDSSGSNKIERGIAIGTGTTKYLREDGTWQTVTSGVSDVKINNTSIVSSGVANIVTNTAYNSSTNKIATMSDIPGDTKVKLTSVTSSSEFPLVLGPSSISSGTAYEGNYVSSITVNASSKQLTLKAVKLDYDSNCYATININGYGGTTTNNTPNVTFYSLKGNFGDTSNHNVYLKGIATPSSDYDAANKKYVDDAVAAGDTKVTNTLATTTKYYVTGTTSSSTNTGTQYFDTGIYATTTAGQLQATSYKVTANATIQYNSTDSSIDFTFI